MNRELPESGLRAAFRVVRLNTVGLVSSYPITTSRFIRFNLVSSLVSVTLLSLNPTFLLRMLMTARYFCLKFRFILIQRVFMLIFPPQKSRSGAGRREQTRREVKKKRGWCSESSEPPLLCSVPIKVPQQWIRPLTTFCCSQFPLGNCSQSPLEHLWCFCFPSSDIWLVIPSQYQV